jgi:hypothetical protein
MACQRFNYLVPSYVILPLHYCLAASLYRSPTPLISYCFTVPSSYSINILLLPCTIVQLDILLLHSTIVPFYQYPTASLYWPPTLLISFCFIVQLSHSISYCFTVSLSHSLNILLLQCPVASLSSSLTITLFRCPITVLPYIPFH